MDAINVYCGINNNCPFLAVQSIETACNVNRENSRLVGMKHWNNKAQKLGVIRKKYSRWLLLIVILIVNVMMTSSNGTIFRVTGHLCGEFTGSGEFPAQRPVTRSFDVFFDLHPNKRSSKQWRGWWFETPSCPLWRHRNVLKRFFLSQKHSAVFQWRVNTRIYCVSHC